MTTPNYNKILYGHDLTENIVAVEPVSGRGMVEVFYREGNTVRSVYEPYKHFMYIRDGNPLIRTLIGCDIYRLAGNGYYNLFVESVDHQDLLQRAKEIEDKHYVWRITDGYLIRSGRTLFKGMEFDDPLVLAVDIETLSSTGGFSDPTNPGDEIIIISMKDNRGNEWLLNQGDLPWECGDEANLLRHFVQEILRIDPDIIIGHNFFGFDMPFIQERCNRHGITLSIGRNGSAPSYKSRVLKLADKRREYDEAKIYGRHVLDTELLARQADSISRSLESYGLKSIIKQLGLASEERTYVEGKDITRTWFEDRNRLLSYAMDDVDETQQLYKMYAGSVFASTQFIPMSLQDVSSRGASAKIENMFMRYYIAHGHSWSKPEPKREYGGGYADVFKFGLAEGPLVYADVDSLYPSLAEVLNIQPKREELGYFQQLLKVLKSKRFELKALIKSDPTNKAKHKATDGAVKVLLNTMSYGYIGYEFGAFNDYDEAERITTNGQNVLKKMIQIGNTFGSDTYKCDTDGALMTVPQGFDADEWCRFMSENMVNGINISNDGVYQRAILFDKKSYILVGMDGELTIKGNTLKGRSIEHFGQAFIRECVDALLSGNKQKLPEIYRKYKERIEQKSLQAKDVVVRKDLKISISEYVRKLNQEKNFNAQPQYEVAKNATENYDVGDAIEYYIKEPPLETVLVRGKEKTRRAKLSAYQKAQHIDHYAFDYDVDHYLDRLNKHLKRFMSLYSQSEFTSTFDVKLYAADRRKYKELYESTS